MLELFAISSVYDNKRLEEIYIQVCCLKIFQRIVRIWEIVNQSL